MLAIKNILLPISDEKQGADLREHRRRMPRRDRVRRRGAPARTEGEQQAGVQIVALPPTKQRPTYEVSRLPKKTPKADVKRGYGFTMEIGFVGALLVVTVLFRLPFRADRDYEITAVEQETVAIEEVLQTKQVVKPPPPPRPPVPVEVPNDVVIEAEELNLDAAYDVGEAVAELPPPPPLPPLPPPEEEPDAEEEIEIFVVVEQMPELIGGIESLQSKIRYPEMARQAGVSGRVFVQFVVDEQGTVTDPIVLRGIGGGCDEEALRVVKTARFTPGKQRGKAVKVRFVIPFRFQLQG